MPLIRFDSPDGEPPRWFVAVLLYGGGLVLLVVLAFFAGAAASPCPEDASDCDLGALAGLVWAFLAFWVGVLAIIAYECHLALRRRDQRRLES